MLLHGIWAETLWLYPVGGGALNSVQVEMKLKSAPTAQGSYHRPERASRRYGVLNKGTAWCAIVISEKGITHQRRARCRITVRIWLASEWTIRKGSREPVTQVEQYKFLWYRLILMPPQEKIYTTILIRQSEVLTWFLKINSNTAMIRQNSSARHRVQVSILVSQIGNTFRKMQ